MTIDPRRRAFLHGATALALMPPLLGVMSCDTETTLRLSGESMGTRWQAVIPNGGHAGDPELLRGWIEAALAGVDRRMSTWRADSELSRFNSGGVDTVHPISEDTRDVAARAMAINRLTDGAFDPTVGPAVRLWGFGPDGAVDRCPPDHEIDAAMSRTGCGQLQMQPSGLVKSVPGLELDLSSIAKGYAADRVSACLAELDVVDHLFELGGEIRTHGRAPGGAPWRVGIEQPVPGPRTVRRVLALGNASVATSGDYRNFLQVADRRYSHVLDPRTARPVGHALASVTVIASNCMDADAFSTALMVMGPEAGLSFARRHGIAALFIARQGRSLRDAASPAMAGFELA